MRPTDDRPDGGHVPVPTTGALRVLIVSPFLPSPVRFGGQRRIDGLGRELVRRGHTVDVVAFSATDEWTERSRVDTSRFASHVATAPDFEPTTNRAKRRRQLASLFSRASYERTLANRPDFCDLLATAVSTLEPDVVQFEFAHTAPFVDAIGTDHGSAVVLDEHNIEFDILRRTAHADGDRARTLFQQVNWRKMAREERSWWRKVDAVALTSARDEEFVRQREPEVRTAVVPNGVDVDTFTPSDDPVDDDSMLFFGAINYFPNTEGVRFFIDEVLPRVRRRRPNARLRVMGPGATEHVVGRRDDHVDLLGMVDDVRAHLGRAAVVVVPLRIGGGTRLKVLEALAAGKAIASTTLGVEGIDAIDGEHVQLADDPDSLADVIAELLADDELRRRLGASGRRLVEQRYSWATVTADLESLYRTVLGGPT